MTDTKTMEELSLEKLKDQIKKKTLDPSQIARSLRIAPSKREILQLPKDLLLKHNALVFHKGSNLSSTQRKMIQDRVAYGLNKGTIKPEEVAQEINKLNALIQGELVKAIEEKKDDSSLNKQEGAGE